MNSHDQFDSLFKSILDRHKKHGMFTINLYTASGKSLLRGYLADAHSLGLHQGADIAKRTTYGQRDTEPNRYSQARLARELGVSRGAIAGRIRRGNLPPFDGIDKNNRGYWLYDTIKQVLDSGADK
ncbi:AsnC family protein [Paenibacillus sp. NRS-1783]|uniref:AsnC family protein n=1 Tax=Paenibacillus sp. NRS-1783 TaxID=3233907 RepID=UPI003D27C85A